MKGTKTRALIVLVLLALGSALLLPSVSGKGNPQKGLPQRVKTLEEQVAALTARVEALEVQCCSNSFDVIHLNLLDDFPSNPSEVDFCAVAEGDGGRVNYYVDGEWHWIIHWGSSPP